MICPLPWLAHIVYKPPNSPETLIATSIVCCGQQQLLVVLPAWNQ